MTLETICDKKWRIIDTYFVTGCFHVIFSLYLLVRKEVIVWEILIVRKK